MPFLSAKPLFFFFGSVVLGLIIHIDQPKTSGQSQDEPSLKIKTLSGFQTERVYSVPKKQGSWVSLAAEKNGCLVASDQYGKLYRIQPNSNPIKITPLAAPIGRAQGLLYAFDSLYVMAHPGGGKPGGIYRLSQMDKDGQYQKFDFLRKLEGGGEHGPHAIVLSPDKKSLVICAGNHTHLPKVDKSRVPQNWKEDQVLPRMWDAGGHAVGKLAPGGWIAKMSPDGKKLECLSTGFRNQYDIAYNADGELFTYDADMEWDVGTPWYRPTRVNHVVSGSEFGWRSGTGKWPEFYPDSLGSVVDIGPGSPTGIAFGTNSNFPKKYQQALFIADWSYGVIYAIHLTKKGASFVGSAQRFCSAPALQVADMAILPSDGSLYFVVGGRRTKSALYRIKLTNEKEIPKDSTSLTNQDPDSEDLFKLRKSLEKHHRPVSQNWQFAAKLLGHSDRNIRYASRIVLEHKKNSGIEMLGDSLKTPKAKIEWALAMVRSFNKSQKSNVLNVLHSFKWRTLTKDEKLSWLRVVGLAHSRWGELTKDETAKIRSQLDSEFPSNDNLIDQELARLLIALKVPEATASSVELLEKSDSQQQQIHYAYCLCWASDGWNLEFRKKYFRWFLKAAALQGGNSFSGFIGQIREQAIGTQKIDSLPKLEKEAIQKILAARPDVADPAAALAKRKFYKKWTLKQIIELDKKPEHEADMENGKAMFRVGLCFHCHRKEGQGGMVGPDLTAAGRRMNQHDLIQSLVDPSAVVSDQYEATMFLMEDGKLVTGRVANLSGNRYMVQTDMLKPSKFTHINEDEIDEMQPSKTSMMPTGLLDTMNEKDIRDLLAFLRSQSKK